MMAEESDRYATYARAMEKVFTDPEVLTALDSDPEGTLERLGFDLTPEARAQLAQGPEAQAAGMAAIVLPAVRVATSPVVRVVVSSSTFAVTTDKGRPGSR